MTIFDTPDAPGRDPDAPQFDMQQNLGALLVLQVKDTQQVETEYGERPVVVADVHVVNESTGSISASYPDAWLFGTVLYSQLRAKVGRPVLGVLELGEKRPGRKPPWRLGDATPQQTEVAVRAMTSRPDQPVEDVPAPEPRQPVKAGADRAPWE